jgi:hypothetical protein
VLVAEMPRYLRSTFIPNDDLLAWRWGQALGAVASAPPPPEIADTDGADFAADRILSYLV